MSDALLKADKDWSKEADKVIPEAESLAQNDLQKAIDNLLALEKKARQSSDLASVSRTLTAVVTICKDQGDWSMLNEQVLLLSKKHGQLKQAITKMVQVVMDFLEDTPSTEVKLSVIETLRTVTEGKVRPTTSHSIPLTDRPDLRRG
jgi:26S proteasome regulatory subunit N5